MLRNGVVRRRPFGGAPVLNLSAGLHYSQRKERGQRVQYSNSEPLFSN
jgi:hypothetical protein